MLFTLILLVLLAAFGGTVAAVFLVFRKGEKEIADQAEQRMSALRGELSQKQELLTELADLSLRFVEPEKLEKVTNERESLKEKLSNERGRTSILQAETETLEVRLRELDEMARELESSNLELARALEVLQIEEADISESNRALQAQIESALIQIDRLLQELSDSHEAVQRLASAKNDLLSAQQKAQFYTQEIFALNKKYIDLKRAYDALDIEYAQLYEKQS